MVDQVNLKWNDFEENVKIAFKENISDTSVNIIVLIPTFSLCRCACIVHGGLGVGVRGVRDYLKLLSYIGNKYLNNCEIKIK